MLWKYKKCYQETTEDSTYPCNSRYLVSMFATPNSLQGGCNEITVSFKYIYSDEIETFTWTISNSAEVFKVGGCIDLSTLSFNCPTRINFTWNDTISCC